MNLVNELQISAEKDDVLTVLRKTKRLASKLGRQDITDWLKAEQEGYFAQQDVPEYRKIQAALAYNTNGYVPAGYGQVMNGVVDLPSMGSVGPICLSEPISTILSMIDSLNGGSGGLFMPIEEGTDESRAIRSCFQFNPMFSHQVTFLLKLNPVQVKAIPEQIKDKVLDWACALESAGVNGDNISFTEREKEISHSITFNISDSHIGQLNNQGTNQQGG
jgi:AbiTii